MERVDKNGLSWGCTRINVTSGSGKGSWQRGRASTTHKCGAETGEPKFSILQQSTEQEDG